MQRPGYLILFFLLGISLAAPAADNKGAAAPDPVDLTIAIGEDAVIDPSLIGDEASINVGLGLFEGLMQYDPATGKGVPGLASSYKLSPDGLSVTFRLRKAQWSDGHPVTAEDFVYAMERVLNPKTKADYAYIPALVIKGAADYNAGKTTDFSTVGIKALDAQTLQYSLLGPAPYFVDMTAQSPFWPLPKWAVEKGGAAWTEVGAIVSNGPYLLKERKRGDYLLLVKNPSYWDAKNVRLRGVKILASSDVPATYELYKTGAVGWMHGMALSKVEEIRQRPDYQSSAQPSSYYYEFNLSRKPFDNLLVRRAFAAAVDREAIAAQFRKDYLPADSLVSPMAGYSPQKGQGYDLEAAKKCLAEAGYPNGKGFPALTLLYSTSATHKFIAESLQQQLQQNLNIKIKLKVVDFDTLLKIRRKTHDFSLVRSGWYGDYLDPDTFLSLFLTGGADNDGGYANPDYDKLVKDAAAASGAERMTMLQEAEKLLMTEDQALLPLFFTANHDLIDSSRWGGWHSNPLGIHPLKYLYKK